MNPNESFATLYVTSSSQEVPTLECNRIKQNKIQSIIEINIHSLGFTLSNRSHKCLHVDKNVKTIIMTRL